MIRKDYIQRYIDELSKVLAVVLQLKNDFKPKEANLQLDNFSTDYLGLDLETIISLDPIIQKLIDQHQFTLIHFKLLEDLLYHKHLLHPENEILKKVTLEVMNFLTKNDTDFSFNRMNRITELS